MSSAAARLERPANLSSRTAYGWRLSHPKFRWFMVASWAGLIFYLSTSGFGVGFTEWLLLEILHLLHANVSPHTFEVLHHLMRKAAHMTEYAVFCLLVYAAFLDAEDFEWRGGLALRSVVIAGLYSLTDEFHQTFVLGRTASIIDCGIDTIGAALSTLIVLVWDRRRTKRNQTVKHLPLASIKSGTHTAD
jgi:VanZ family protein